MLPGVFSPPRGRTQAPAPRPPGGPILFSVKWAGALALLASLAMAAGLALGLREVRCSGTVITSGPTTCLVDVGPTWNLDLLDLPATFPGGPDAIRVQGTKGDSWHELRLGLPDALRTKAIEHARVELRHVCLTLPWYGAVAGRTWVRIGHAAWHEPPWRLWGAWAGLAAAPLLLWLAAALPWALVEKRRPPA